MNLVTPSIHRVRNLVVGLLIAGALSAPLAHAQEPAARLTLQGAVDEALRSRAVLRASEAGQAAADAQLAEARAGRLPQLIASERLTNGNNPIFVFGTALEQARFGPENFDIDALNRPDPVTNFRSQIDLKVPLFDQRQTSSKIEQARIAREQADADREYAEQAVRLQVVQAYYGVLLADAAAGVADEAVRSAEADLARIRDRFDAGLVVASDLLALQVQLAEFRQQKIQADGDAISARAALNTAIGARIDGSWTLGSTIGDRRFDAAPIEALLQTALEHRPDYRQYLLRVRARSEEIRATRGEYLPRVDAFASAGNSGNRLVNGSGDYSVGVSVTFNLFDAGRRARVDRAQAAFLAAEADRDEGASQIRLEVVRAHQGYLAAAERLTVTAKAIEQAAETLRIVRDRYEVGLTTVTEVLRAETALVRARLNDHNARYAYTVGYAQILFTTGRLVDVAPFVR